MKAKRECFKDYVDVTGVLVPKEEVLVRPDREGLQIAKVFVEAGDTVKSGQVLAAWLTGARRQRIERRCATRRSRVS